jgi:hypothetical protein
MVESQDLMCGGVVEGGIGDKPWLGTSLAIQTLIDALPNMILTGFHITAACSSCLYFSQCTFV